MPDKPEKSIEQIVKEDGRYTMHAVQFVREGLNRTIEQLHPEASGPGARRHITGAELADGLRHLALKRWGMLTRMVLKRWNITETRDFGEIVFLLIDAGWMQKEPQDFIEDFDNVFDFAEAFETDFDMPDQLE